MDVLFATQANKENCNSSTNKELQRLKVQLNDRIFDINKLQQDYAQEKAKFTMEFQKEKLNLNKIIKELKQRNQQDNDQWGKKIQQHRTNSKDQISNIKLEYEKLIQQEQIKISKQFGSKFQQQMMNLSKQLQEKTISYKDSLTRLQRQKQWLVNQLNMTHSNQITKKQLEFKQIHEDTKKQYESKINVLQNLYIAQQQQKSALAKKHEMYVHDSIKTIIARQKEIELIKQTVATLREENSQLNKQIQFLKNIQITNSQRTEQRIKQLNINKIKDINKLLEQFEIKYALQKKYFEQQIEKIKDEVQQMKNIYKQKEKKWEERGQIMLKTIQISHKKPDSFKTLQILQTQLVKKDSLLKRERQNLKNCQLTLQNMEQIYDKMFVSNNYLYKSRSKSYKIKKNRLATQLNQSNKSTFVEQRFCTEGDK